MMNLINFASINVAIGWTIYLCISRIAGLMEWEGEFIKLYPNRMRKIKISCISFIVGVIIFFILLAKSIGLYKLLDLLTGKIIAFFNGTQSDKVQVINTKPEINTTPLSLPDSMKNLQPSGKNSYLITFLLNLVQLIIGVVLVIIIIYLIYKLFIIVKNFYKGLCIKKIYKTEKRELIFSLEDIIKEIKNRSEGFSIGLELPFNMSNGKKIRKLYKKLIKSYKTKEILACNFNTPMEIQIKVKEVLEKNISEATIIYEKARYSNEECSKEEVDKIKSFLFL